MRDEHTDVLIVGGAMVGLSAALFLARQGVGTLLVERHESALEHPRAGAISPRAMEILRSAGLEPTIRAAVASAVPYADVLQVDSLASPGEEKWFAGPFPRDPDGVSVTGWALIGQDRLEPILREDAAARGADIRFGNELVGLHQGADEVVAVIRPYATGESYRVHARYVVAADGSHSPIRARLGIGTTGPGTLGRLVLITFRADLRPYLPDRRFFICFVRNPKARGGLGEVDVARGRWSLGITFPADPPPDPATFTADRCAELVRAAVGVADLPVDILSVHGWEMAARCAERFQDGRIFLAGDAAHVNPPTGGFGGGLGIQDADNLAWKLALVLRGRAGPALLDTYTAERRPVAAFTIEQAVLRYRRNNHGVETIDGARLAPDATVIFGGVYGGGPGRPVAEDPRRAPAAVGRRAPHALLRRHGDPCAVHDLVTRHFVLLAGEDGEPWCRAAGALGVPVEAYRVGADGLRDPGGAWRRRYGLTSSGAVLIRPDGYVAWLAPGTASDPGGTLRRALADLLAGAGVAAVTR